MARATASISSVIALSPRSNGHGLSSQVVRLIVMPLISYGLSMMTVITHLRLHVNQKLEGLAGTFTSTTIQSLANVPILGGRIILAISLPLTRNVSIPLGYALTMTLMMVVQVMREPNINMIG